MWKSNKREDITHEDDVDEEEIKVEKTRAGFENVGIAWGMSGIILLLLIVPILRHSFFDRFIFLLCVLFSVGCCCHRIGIWVFWVGSIVKSWRQNCWCLCFTIETGEWFVFVFRWDSRDIPGQRPWFHDCSMLPSYSAEWNQRQRRPTKPPTSQRSSSWAR